MDVATLVLTIVVMLLRWWLGKEGEKRREENDRRCFNRALARGDAWGVSRMLAHRVRPAGE